MATGEWITSEPETFSVPGHGADTHSVPGSHYPTSAELAALRRTFGKTATDNGHRSDRIYDPATGTLVPVVAWPDEREHGIGTWPTIDAVWGEDIYQLPDARREANRMRRETWERQPWRSIRTRFDWRVTAWVPFHAEPESESELRFAYGDR